MIFDVLSSTIHFSKWGEGDASLSLSFCVAPKDLEQLDIGDKYIFCASGYLPMRDKERQPISATVSVSSDPRHLEHIKGANPICGCADFFEERQGLDGDYTPASLRIMVVVEDRLFQEMLHVRSTQPGAATLHAEIEGLTFGWEPDGSHQVWNLKEDADCGLATRRRVTSFWCNVETFATTKGAIREEAERKDRAELAESNDPDDRKLAANLQPPEKPDPIAQLLRHCRTILLALLVLGVVAMVKLNR